MQKNKNSLYIHTRTYNEFFVIYIGSFDTPSTIYVAVKNFYFTIFLDAFDPSVYVMVRMQMPFAGALSLRPERS